MEGTETKTEVEEKEEKEEKKTGTEGESKKETKPEVDTKKIGDSAVSSFLENLGVDEESLKGIVAKHKKDEEANKTELQKAQDKTTKLETELVEERKKRVEAELKLSAIQMGANKETVDDLVVIAQARVTKDKDINAVMAEIKDSSTGSIYFVSEDEDETKANKKKSTTITRVESKEKKKQEKHEDEHSEDNSHEGSIAARIFAKKKAKGESHYFSK